MIQTIDETWQINARLNLYLLDAITDEQLGLKLEKGKTVLGNLTHLHNVRLMWLKSALPEALEGIAKLDEKTIRADLIRELGLSTEAISKVILKAGSPDGKVKGFKPHAAAFVGYLTAHEAFHRTSIEITLRQHGCPLNDKVAYGLWEWGTR
jgi:uncharacterized damage-inducible protein DinB